MNSDPGRVSEEEYIRRVRKDPYAFRHIPEADVTVGIAVAACLTNIAVHSSVPKSMSLVTQAVAQLLNVASMGASVDELKAQPVVKAYIELESNGAGSEAAWEGLLEIARRHLAHEVSRHFEASANLTVLLSPDSTGAVNAEFADVLRKAHDVVAAARPDEVHALGEALLEVSMRLFKASRDKEALALRAVGQLLLGKQEPAGRP